MLRNYFAPLATCVLVALLATSCLSQYLTGYTAKKPYANFQPCSVHADEEGLGSYAFAAIVLSLVENGWVLEEISEENGAIRAKSCWRVVHCASMIFHPYDSGVVSVYSPEGEALDSGLEDDMLRWTLDLEKSYSKYSCYSMESLREQMKPYDLDF